MNAAPAGWRSRPWGNNPQNGIMATPVIDRVRRAIYVVALSQTAVGSLVYRLHALDLGTGAELFGGPVAISAHYPGSGGNSTGGLVSFDPLVHQERAALLEAGSNIVLAWGGRDGDCGQYSSWVMAYDASTLQQTGVIDLVPNDHGAGIWMSGAGPAMDASGDIYLVTGNAFAGAAGGGTPATGSYGNSIVRLSASAGLGVGDYSAPANAAALNAADLDLGGGGALLLPDELDASGATRHLAVAAGKDSHIYLVDRDHLGQFDTAQNHIVQEIAGQLGGRQFRSQPATFQHTVYLSAAGDPLKAFPLSAARLATAPSSQTGHAFADGVPVVSANGTANGIVWMVEGGAGQLFAYDATDLSRLLWSSSQAAGGRDQFAASGRPKSALVVNGRVYVGTSGSVSAFGLLP